MRLGTQTGSLVNHVMSRQVIGQPEPVKGMGCTILCWTDRRPGTIFHIERAVRTTKGVTRIWVREDKATRVDKNGLSECQEWTFEANPNGSESVYQQVGHDGPWRQVYMNPKTGRWNKADGNGLRIGERGKYHDFSF